MARSVRWLVPARWLIAVASTVGAFGICLWLFRFVSFSWMPHAEADRWVVATAFAAVAADAVGAATGWWAGREHKRPDLPSTKVAAQTSPLGRQAVSGGEGLARRLFVAVCDPGSAWGRAPISRFWFLRERSWPASAGRVVRSLRFLASRATRRSSAADGAAGRLPAEMGRDIGRGLCQLGSAARAIG